MSTVPTRRKERSKVMDLYELASRLSDLRKDGKTIVERQFDFYRVVSELRELKGEKRAWLCNEQGRQEVGRQDRIVSPQNAAFDRWHRGAIVQIEKIVRKERGGKVSSLGRIERDGAVRIIRPV